MSQEAGKGCGIGEGLENKGGGGGRNDGGPSAENLGQIGLFLSKRIYFIKKDIHSSKVGTLEKEKIINDIKIFYNIHTIKNINKSARM